MEYVLLGTAGHVDHGKSTLIKALSGIDPDRLKEEKERGMTTDIGFANFILPSGRCAQVIDVPGHERFIKNMLTGINTIDLVLFLIDAKEGIKPQTREHFDILRLLDIKNGIIVITKIDLVDKEQLDLLTEEIKEFVKESFLEDAPIVNISTIVRTGLDELKTTIDRLATGVRKRDMNLPVRYPIDRIFTMSGSGAVVTGTLISGVLKVGDSLEVLPQQERVRVRQIQSYGGKILEALAGQRMGLNLAGLKKEKLERGNVLTTPGYLKPTYMFDARLELLPACPRPLKHNTRVRLHAGTGEFLGRVVLLDKDKIEPGQNAFIQFRSEGPLAIAKDDRFVIRFYAPVITAGGGRILDAHPVRHKRLQPEIIKQLESLTSATPEESVAQILINAGLNILNVAEVTTKTNLPHQETENILKELEEKKEILRSRDKPNYIMHVRNLNLFKDKLVEILDEFHKKQPLKSSMPVKEAKRKLVKTETQVEFFDKAVTELTKTNKIILKGNALKLARHTIKLSPKQEALRHRVESFYLDNLFAPAGLDVLTQTLKIKPKAAEEMIATLKEMSILVRLPENIIMHQEAVTKASELIKNHLTQHEKIKPGECAKLLKTSRKYVIPLLEHLDSIRLTKRVGDVRILCS